MIIPSLPRLAEAVDALARRLKELEEKFRVESVSEAAAQPITTTINSKGEINVSGTRLVRTEVANEQEAPKSAKLEELPHPIKVEFVITNPALVLVNLSGISLGAGQSKFGLFLNETQMINENRHLLEITLGGGNNHVEFGEETHGIKQIQAAEGIAEPSRPEAAGDLLVLTMQPGTYTLELRGRAVEEGVKIRNFVMSVQISEAQ